MGKQEKDLGHYFAIERQQMVHDQLEKRGIVDERVLQAMGKIPRHVFVPQQFRSEAYQDGPLPIGHQQTISQPYIVALMTQMLHLRGPEKVLEVGTGSGYQAAILAVLASEVHTIERNSALSRNAAATLEALHLTNVHFHVGDGSLGLPRQAPFDAIIVTAGAPKVPHTLLEQLTEQGRLVIPVGHWGGQALERWWRTPTGFDHETIAPVAFVPLIGKFGWPPENHEAENENAPE